MPLLPISAYRKPKEGGAGIGGILGAVAGAIAAPFTGGASLAGVAAGMGAGKTLGGLAGGIADPGKPGGQGAQLAQSAISRRAGAEAPQNDTSAILKESLIALKEVSPEVQEAYKVPLVKAYGLSTKGNWD